MDAIDRTGIQEDADDGARQAAVAIYNLAASVESKNHAGLLANAQLNLDFLDAFLYDYLDLEIARQNDDVIDAHELMAIERKRQDAHVSLLLGRDALASVVSELRAEVTGISIVGQLWYR